VACEFSAQALVQGLARRKGLILPGPRLAAVGPFTPEKAWVTLRSRCFAAVVLFFSPVLLGRLLTVCCRDSPADEEPLLHRAVLSGHPVRYHTGKLPVMAVPFVGRRGPLGAVTFTGNPQRRYSEEDLELAEELAQRVAVAIERVRLYEQAQEALRARDEFLSIAAHEIRGPLMSIHLGVESLHQNSVPAAEVPRVLDILLREERRLGQFVNDLLEFGRIRAGRFRLEIEDVDLVEVVGEVAQRLRGELARSGSTLSVKTEGPVIGQWDRLRLDQVVNNLLSNAIKFGLGRPIEISAHGREGKAVLSVRDHGIGIPPDKQEEVFDPFVRTVSDRRYDGLGLGLYIVRSIVTGLGGEVRSASGAEGTTFTIELPMARVP
jgi:signal transduction histidine kinase